MAPRDKRDKAHDRAQDRILSIASSSGRTRGKATARRGNEVPDVYQDLLSEATAGSDDAVQQSRPLKRRKVKDGRVQNEKQPRGADSSQTTRGDGSSPGSRLNPQTLTDSEASDEDDLDWEQIGLDVTDTPSKSKDIIQNDDELEVSVNVAGTYTPRKAAVVRRKAVTAAERSERLAVHKAHLLFLLFHVHVRNAWCNSGKVQSALKSFLSSRIISSLNPRSDLHQLRRSDLFLDGLKLAVDLWRVKYTVTVSGMRRPFWSDEPAAIKESLALLQDEMDAVGKQDFIRMSSSRKGSQDVGNQLFCALLRAVGVETRLVCSLQSLPFNTTGQKLVTPQKQKPTVYADPDSEPASTTDGSVKGLSSEEPSRSAKKAAGPRQRRRIGQPSLGMPVGNYRQAPLPAKKRRVQKLDYPVFWVEAFNPAYQKWIAVDATVTGTISKPSRLEPPASYELNAMTYVVAFDEDHIAKDVTRRYTRAYNAKTRKQRVEATEGGVRWWENALKTFKRSHLLTRDQIEEAELIKKEASEGLPNSVQDFKDHPYYVLERHLKRHEVIAPKREVGKISAGKNSGLEPVYRRQDVQTLKSADKWFRFGREVKAGEQALKHVAARSRRSKLDYAGDMDTDTEESTTSALYAFSQTELYVPPSVVRGKVPKNVYGNLDIYVPSMIPPGGSHIRHPWAIKAARTVGVDYAEAVTGFQFKGRQGTAVTDGVIVATEYRDAVAEVIQGMAHDLEDKESEKRSLESLRLWKRLLTGLRIAERLGLHAGGDEVEGRAEDVRQQLEEAEDEDKDTAEAGGFFPGAGEIEVTEPTARRTMPSSDMDDDDSYPALSRQKRKRGRTAVDSSEDEDAESDYVESEPSTRSPAANNRGRRAPDAGRTRQSASDALVKDSYGEKQYTHVRIAIVDGPPIAVKTDPSEHPKTIERPTQVLEEETPESPPMMLGGLLAPDASIAVDDFAGGFVPDDGTDDVGDVPMLDDTADESGGGFMPDESIDDSGGGFMVDEATDDLDGLAETQRPTKPESPSAPDVNDADSLGDPLFDVTEQDSQDTETDGGPPQSSLPKETLPDVEELVEDEDPESSEVEKGSLLSHDPEDEDAEPDWLQD